MIPPSGPLGAGGAGSFLGGSGSLGGGVGGASLGGGGVGAGASLTGTGSGFGSGLGGSGFLHLASSAVAHTLIPQKCKYCFGLP